MCKVYKKVCNTFTPQIKGIPQGYISHISLLSLHSKGICKGTSKRSKE